ncbi:hypothetical protein FKM82_026957 [Ascaphus truei]
MRRRGACRPTTHAQYCPCPPPSTFAHPPLPVRMRTNGRGPLSMAARLCTCTPQAAGLCACTPPKRGLTEGEERSREHRAGRE